MKKIIITAIVLLFIPIFASAANSPYTDDDFDTTGNLLFRAEYPVYPLNARDINYYMKNGWKTKRAEFGEHFSVEYFEGETWKHVYAPEETPGASWALAPGEKQIYGLTVPSNVLSRLGEYRVIKRISGKNYFARFSVEKDPIRVTPDMLKAALGDRYLPELEYTHLDNGTNVWLFMEHYAQKSAAFGAAYGGSYIDRSQKRIRDVFLYVEGTPGTELFHAFVRQLAHQQTRSVMTRAVFCSEKELKQLATWLDYGWLYTRELYDELGVVYGYVDIMENCFVVGLTDTSEDNLARFRREIFDHPRLVFRKAEPIEVFS